MMGLDMNKNDIKLIIIILVVVVIFFAIQLSRKKAEVALVYHNSDTFSSLKGKRYEIYQYPREFSHPYIIGSRPGRPGL